VRQLFVAETTVSAAAAAMRVCVRAMTMVANLPAPGLGRAKLLRIVSSCVSVKAVPSRQIYSQHREIRHFENVSHR
jgi:hypothetical protein